MNQFRNFAVWIVIALLLFALFSVFQGQVGRPSSSELSYSEFLDKANSGAIQSIVITGDKTQVDLPRREDSGLMQIERILHGIEGIAFHYFTDADVVRHRLVRDIIRAYNADAAGA